MKSTHFIACFGWTAYDKMGIRSSSTAELIFNDVKIPKLRPRTLQASAS